LALRLLPKILEKRGLMKTVELKVFKISVEDEVIVFIPQLAKVYKTDSKNAKKITDTVTVKEENFVPEEQSVFQGGTLKLTKSCNLYCTYCQENCGAVLKNKVMPWEIATAAMDYIFKNAKKEPISLNFLGGEATLEWDLLKASVDYFRRLGLKKKEKTIIGITTNGCFAPYKADWLALNMDNILLALDGFKAIQDEQRGGSFDQVFENAKKIYAKAPAKLQFKTIISAESLEQLPQIVTFFGENFPGCTQSYEPLFEKDRGKNKILKSPAINLFFDKLLEILPLAQQYGSKITTSGAGIKPPSVAFCGAGETNFVITCEGQVVANSREGEEAFTEYGHFEPKKKVFVFDKEKQEQLTTLRTENIKEGTDCYARFNCRGACRTAKAELEVQEAEAKGSYSCEEIRRFTSKFLKLKVEEAAGTETEIEKEEVTEEENDIF
jgi:radical SAM protein with 4Fe4S-binding SPASM domain